MKQTVTISDSYLLSARVPPNPDPQITTTTQKTAYKKYTTPKLQSMRNNKNTQALKFKTISINYEQQIARKCDHSNNSIYSLLFKQRFKCTLLLQKMNHHLPANQIPEFSCTVVHCSLLLLIFLMQALVVKALGY